MNTFIHRITTIEKLHQENPDEIVIDLLPSLKSEDSYGARPSIEPQYVASVDSCGRVHRWNLVE
jgi:hypothetical protein